MSRQFPVFAGQRAQSGEADLHATAGETAAKKIRNEMFAEIVHGQESFLSAGESACSECLGRMQWFANE